jgi:transcriptional regulator with XRE-family HTH domain
MRNSYRLWNLKEINLLEEGIKNQSLPNLNELEQKLNRGGYSIICFLSRLKEINPIGWNDLYLFYSKQFYQEHKPVYSLYKKSEITINHKKEYNKEYYQYLKGRPYLEAGRVLTKYLEIKYGKRYGSREKFADDLGIKRMGIIYDWLSGMRMSWRKYLNRISGLLNINENDLRRLQKCAKIKFIRS